MAACEKDNNVDGYEKFLEDFREAVTSTTGAGGFADALTVGEMPDFISVVNFITQNVLADCNKYIELLSLFFAVIMFSSLIREIGGNLKKAADLAACAVIVGAVMKSGLMNSDVLFEGIERTAVFIKAFIPIFAALTALAGNITMSSVYGTVALLCTQLFSRVNTAIIIPVTNILISVGVISFVAGGDQFAKVGKGIKKVIVALLCAMSTIMMTVMSLNGFATRGTDALVYKAGKFVSGSAIPGIGNTISGGYETVFACFTAAKSLCGTSGIVVILFVTGPYIIRVCMLVAIMAVAEITADFFSCGTLSSLFAGFKEAGKIILSSYAFELLVLTFGIALIMTVGG